jgi:hypothetical protein
MSSSKTKFCYRIFIQGFPKGDFIKHTMAPRLHRVLIIAEQNIAVVSPFESSIRSTALPELGQSDVPWWEAIEFKWRSIATGAN